MERLIYALCFLTSVLCAGLLIRSYLATRFRMLLWSGLCFIGLGANNLMLIVDRVVFPADDLSVWRLAMALLSVMLLVIGLVMESGR